MAVLGVVAVAGLGGGSNSATPPLSDLGAINDPTLTAPATSADPVVIATDPAALKTVLTSTLRYGSNGAEVQALQQRLTDLHFAPGPIDGQFGGTTQQAVWAFEKLVMDVPRALVTGKVTNDMWQVMQDRLAIAPRRPTGAGTTHMEVYMPQQVVAIFTDDVPTLVTHVSTGIENPDTSPKEWCETVTYDTDEYGVALDKPVEKAVCALAKTPGGIFEFNRRYTGKRISPLGGMTNPVYFNYGIAIHGADNVPKEPASHGCIRVNQTIAMFLPSLVKNGDRVYVWGEGGKEPENYTKAESLPSFNYADPSATTTTSTTITTAATSTTAAPTTTSAQKSTTTSTSVAATPSATTTTVPTTTTTVATTTTAGALAGG